MNSSSSMPSLRQTCLPNSDSKFGPAVAYDCRQFDFTLYFEQIFMSLVPSLFFILLSPIRVAAVVRRNIKTLSTPFHGAKIVTETSLASRLGILTSSDCDHYLHCLATCALGTLVSRSSSANSRFNSRIGPVAGCCCIHLHLIPPRARENCPSINHYKHLLIFLIFVRCCSAQNIMVYP